MNRRSHDRQKGLALILVLWVVVLLAVMATALARTRHVQTAMTIDLVSARLSRSPLEAGLQYMMAQLENRAIQAPDNPWPVDGRLRPWHFSGQRIWIGAEPESTRLDLNLASEERLQQLLLTVGMQPQSARNLAEAILDWRDRDHTPSPHGAEDADYRVAGLPGGARDGAFDSIAELILVEGMSRKLLHRLYPLLSVHSYQGDEIPIRPSETPPTYLGGPGQEERPPTTRPRTHHVFRLYAELEIDNGHILRQSMVVDTRFRGRKGYRVLSRHLHPATFPRRIRRMDRENGE